MQVTRTVQATPVKSNFNGKWACVFHTFATYNGVEHLMEEVTTSALWFDAEAAQAAGDRALEVLAGTNRYPNMCEVW